jgi:hypothetical protein
LLVTHLCSRLTLDFRSGSIEIFIAFFSANFVLDTSRYGELWVTA